VFLTSDEQADTVAFPFWCARKQQVPRRGLGALIIAELGELRPIRPGRPKSSREDRRLGTGRGAAIVKAKNSPGVRVTRRGYLGILQVFKGQPG
jgi:hypothetical protein